MGLEITLIGAHGSERSLGMPVLALGTERAPVFLHVRTLLVELGVLEWLEAQEVLERVAERAQTRQELVVDDGVGQHALVDDLFVLVVLAELFVVVVRDDHGVLLLGQLEYGRVLLMLELGGHSCGRVVQNAALDHALELLARIHSAQRQVRARCWCALR